MKTIVMICGLSLLLACGSTAAQAPQPDGTGTLALGGTINVIWTDPLPGYPGEPGVLYRLVDSNGQRWKLDLDQSQLADIGGAHGLKGRQVIVTGSAVTDRDYTLSVRDIALSDEKEMPLPCTYDLTAVEKVVHVHKTGEPDSPVFFLIFLCFGSCEKIFWNS